MNAHVPVIVGLMDCDNAGAAFDGMNVVAVPLTAVRPTVAVGFAGPAPAGVDHVPSPRQNVAAEAEMPELRFVVGRLLTTPPDPDADRLMLGRVNAGVDHVPVPFQNVVADAFAPPFKLLTGRLPNTPLERLIPPGIPSTKAAICAGVTDTVVKP